MQGSEITQVINFIFLTQIYQSLIISSFIKKKIHHYKCIYLVNNGILLYRSNFFFSALHVTKCIKLYLISVVHRSCTTLMICWFNLIWLCMSIKAVLTNKNIPFVHVFLLEIITPYPIKYQTIPKWEKNVSDSFKLYTCNTRICLAYKK